MTSLPQNLERRPHILVVDDEHDNRELLEIVLRWDGFDVLTASSGEEALAMVAEYEPDLVLLDIMMPGMTGYQVVASIKHGGAARHTPVIMVTALTDPQARAHALSAGADDFIGKPVARVELLARVQHALRRGSDEVRTHGAGDDPRRG